MLSLFRAKTQKDFSDKLLGKTRKYRLSRHGAAVAVTGKLLAHYQRQVAPDGLMPPAAGRVERLGLLLSAAGRFVICYAVSYPETEDIAGRQEYVHVCPSLDAVREFLAAMHYPDKGEFAEAALVQAAKTLAGDARTAPRATETRCQMPAAEPAAQGGDASESERAAQMGDELESERAAQVDDAAEAERTMRPGEAFVAEAPADPARGAGPSDIAGLLEAAVEAGVLPAATGKGAGSLPAAEAPPEASRPVKPAP